MPGSFLIGVNLAGAEFGPPYNNFGQLTGKNVPGVFGTDYTYPTHTEIDYYAAKGMEVIRLPFLWEHVSSKLWLRLWRSDWKRGDAQYRLCRSVGQARGVTTESNSLVIFDLMNEPHDQTATEWLGSVQRRDCSDPRHRGNAGDPGAGHRSWDGAWTWVGTDNHNDTVHRRRCAGFRRTTSRSKYTSISTPMAAASKPGAESVNTGVERHHGDHGMGGSDRPAVCFSARSASAPIRPVWARSNNMLSYMQQHPGRVAGRRLLGGRPLVGLKIIHGFSIEPENGDRQAADG